jgi:hypothetical protein
VTRVYNEVVLPNELDTRALGGSPSIHKANGDYYPWNYHMLLSEFSVMWHQGIITVPAQFIYDRASIPSFLQGFKNKEGPWDRGSVIHDWVFVNKGVPGCETFEDANELFKQCMIEDQASENDIDTIMAAVTSAFGQAAWDND